MVTKNDLIPEPEIISYTSKDNLRDAKQQADYIIITHPDFLKQAEEK